MSRQTEQQELPYHILICGFGSIGRRHFRHFKGLGCRRVEVYSTGLGTMKEDSSLVPDAIHRDLEAALGAGPDVVVVANPTSLHLPVARAAVEAGSHVLVEKPLSSSLEGCDELAELAHRRGVVVGVAFNQRFNVRVRECREWIRSGQPLGQVLLARAHVGGFLPDWHPWEDYRLGYAARVDLGGGASLVNIHEIDFLLWMLGAEAKSVGLPMGTHPLATDVDEASGFVVQHSSGALSVISLSLCQKPQTRTLELSFTRGNARINLASGERVLSFADGHEEVECSYGDFSMDSTYRLQALDFLSNAIHGKPSDVATLEEAVAAQSIALKGRIA